MWELVQVSSEYAHAVLLAILPFISDFSCRLDLPIGSVTTNQVVEFKCDPRQGQTGGALTLANGYKFTFFDGRVSVYRSPQSYFSLQDPEQVSTFFGPVKLSETQALQIALGAIRKLGYEAAVFDADKAPVITPPRRIGTNYVTRYLFRWRNQKWPISQNESAVFPSLLDMEINASNGQIEMVVISSRETRRPSPKADVVPQVSPQKATNQNVVNPSTSVNENYSKAFLEALLPQVSDFIVKTGLKLSTPMTTNQITNYVCRIQHGEPFAQFYLLNGDRFNFNRGYIAAFYAHDALDKFPDTGRSDDFLGHLNMTTDEAISFCEGVMRKLGYAKKFPKPIISYSPARGSLACKRYKYYWQHDGEDSDFASIEVDMETKEIKSIYLNDPAFKKVLPKAILAP